MKKILCALLVAVAAFGVACDKSTEIKVMSYNIRYLNNKDGENHWDNRKHASINMIREEQPTVFGTQEGVWEQMSYFVENLPEYGHIGIGQDDGKLEGEIMSIFYHKDKVELAVSSGSRRLPLRCRRVGMVSAVVLVLGLF